MKKILVIPHHPNLKNLKIRLIEIAKRLSLHNDVYLLNWYVPQKNYNMKDRIIYSLNDLFKKTMIFREGKLNVLEIPNLRRPLWFLQKFNSHFLYKVIEREGFDIVINGSYYQFPIRIENKGFRYIYDLADLPASGKKGSFGYFAGEKTKKEALKADAVTVISNEMVNYVKEQYGLEASFVPNGADIKKIRSVSETDTINIRKRYGLLDKWVIGYVGYIGSWVNVDLVVESFKLIKKEIPDAALIWVGLSPNLTELRKKYSAKDIIFTGGISEDIEPYINVFDVCILPHRESPFQDRAFHLKVIEYTASRKIVISNRLKETQRLGFPNIIFAPEEVEEWRKAILDAREKKWLAEWDNLVDSYDWEKVVEKLMTIAESIN